MRSKRTYSVVAYTASDPTKTWEESLRDSMGTCRTIKKAYEIALFLSGISKPNLNYRQVLRRLKQKGAVQIKHEDGNRPETVTIVHTKAY